MEKAEKLFDEVIAEADLLKEMATKLAKDSIYESLTPAIKSMLSQKLAEDLDEMEDKDEVKHEDEVKVDEAGKDHLEPDGDEAPEESMEEALIKKLTEAGVDEATLEAVKKAMYKEEKGEHSEEGESKEVEGDMESGEEEKVDEELDLEAILAEMEDEGEKDEMKESKDEETKPAEDEEHSKEGEDEVSEDLDIDALLAEMEAEEDESEKGKEENQDENAQVLELKQQLQESNLIMAKLLYQNKLLSKGNLSEATKAKILDTFSKAKTVQEVKLLFETFETLTPAPIAKTTPISESLGFKFNQKPEPKQENKQQVLSEEAKLFQRRAGIIPRYKN